MAGQDTAVCIQLCRRIIIISGTQMHITTDSVFLTPHDQRNLAVCLEAMQSIDHMAACLFEHLRPVDIIFLVKARLQLDEHRNLLAVLRRLRECCDNRRIAADPVQRLLDREHIRIRRRLLYELNHRLEGHIRMMQQDIASADLRKNIFLIVHARNRLWAVRRIAVRVHPVNPVQFHQKGQIKRSADPIDIILFYRKLLLQNFQKLRLHFILYLQTDDLSPLTLLQLLLNLLEQICRIVLVNRQIRIPHDPVRVRTDDIVVQKQLVNVALDDFFKQCHTLFPVRSVRKPDNPRQYRRYLYRCKFSFALFALLGNQCADIQCLIANQRKRPGGIHRHRRKHRIDRLLKILIRIMCLLF